VHPFRIVAAAAALQFLPPAGHAALPRRSRPRSHTSSNISLRKRVHVNTLITEPGAVAIVRCDTGWNSTPDHPVVFGLTINVGKLR